MIILFQTIIVLAALLALHSVIKKTKTRTLDRFSGTVWSLIWMIGIVVVVWPNSTSVIASFFGIGRGVDLGIYVAIGVLFYLVFRMQVSIEQINRHITTIVRDRSIKEKDKQ